jgi:hypothetical protein
MQSICDLARGLKALPVSKRSVVCLCNENSENIAIILTHILQRCERESEVADRDWNQFCEATTSLAVRIENARQPCFFLWDGALSLSRR